MLPHLLHLDWICPRASSNKVGGGGIRYTVQIHGQEKYLFCEGNKWFVEARA